MVTSRRLEVILPVALLGLQTDAPSPSMRNQMFHYDVSRKKVSERRYWWLKALTICNKAFIKAYCQLKLCEMHRSPLCFNNMVSETWEVPLFFYERYVIGLNESATYSGQRNTIIENKDAVLSSISAVSKANQNTLNRASKFWSEYWTPSQL